MGLDFIAAATLVSALTVVIRTLPFSAFCNGLYTFFAGGLTLLLAVLFSKLFRVNWAIKDNRAVDY